MFKLIKAFVKKELVQALRDPRMKFMLFVTPIIQMTIFGLALNADMKNIKLYSRPMINDPLLNDMHRDAIASGWFIKAKDQESMIGDDISPIQSGSAEVGLYGPQGGLTQAFEMGKGRVEAVIDGTNLIRARSIVNYLANIVSRAVMERLGRPDTYEYMIEAQTKPENTVKTPMEFVVRILYNPELVSAYNLVPGVICMLMCIITIMLTSMSIAKEKEIGTFETLISAPISATEIILGKTIPYLIIGCINLPLIFFVAVAGFDVPMRGSYIWLMLATIFFLITTVSIGTLISTVARNQQQAMMGGFIFLMPALLLSGIMYPIDSMPLSMKIVAAFDPLMYYITLLRNIMLKGGDIEVMFLNVGALFLIAVVCVITAFKRFRLHLG